MPLTLMLKRKEGAEKRNVENDIKVFLTLFNETLIGKLTQQFSAQVLYSGSKVSICLPGFDDIVDEHAREIFMRAMSTLISQAGIGEVYELLPEVRADSRVEESRHFRAVRSLFFQSPDADSVLNKHDAHCEASPVSPL